MESTPGREVHVQSLWGSPGLVLFKALRASQCGWRGGGHAEAGSKGGQLPLMGMGCWLSWSSPERTPMPSSVAVGGTLRYSVNHADLEIRGCVEPSSACGGG